MNEGLARLLARCPGRDTDMPVTYRYATRSRGLPVTRRTRTPRNTQYRDMGGRATRKTGLRETCIRDPGISHTEHLRRRRACTRTTTCVPMCSSSSVEMAHGSRRARGSRTCSRRAPLASRRSAARSKRRRRRLRSRMLMPRRATLSHSHTHATLTPRRATLSHAHACLLYTSPSPRDS